MNEPYRLRELVLDDYETVRALWEATEGVGLNESDTREAVAVFLARNPQLSLVALDRDGAIVGAVLCGHDGRRGYLHHLAVQRAHRGRGLGRRLVATCLDRLRVAGILKCNIFLYASHHAGRSFWLHHGWAPREDLVVMQKPT
jgi:N-acetylglutamate synthase